MTREQTKARTEAELARAAAELFARQGVAQTTVEQIAERAGVSERTFFRYFPTKEDAVLSYIWLKADDLRSAFLDRPPSESLAEAFLASVRATKTDDEAQATLDRELLRLLRNTPTLRARWLVAGWETAAAFTPLVAERLACEPDALMARLATNALLVAIQTALDVVGEHGADFLEVLTDAIGRLADGAGLATRPLERPSDSQRSG